MEAVHSQAETGALPRGPRVLRQDIQGIRAVGALVVAVYHIWVGRVSGGVDVFFVVSGYLLIGSLSRQLEAKGEVDLLAFVVRLAQRLLPMSLFVAAVVLATGWLWLPEGLWSTSIRQIPASVLYVENWYLALNSIDYLARDEVGAPMQHYWAMSAQVQALILIALILAVAGWICRRASIHPTRKAILFLLTIIFVGSLCYSMVMTSRNQPFAYFDTLARIWEFVAGGLVALLVPSLRLGDRYRLILGWIGLVGILACGIVLDVSTLFPGFAALWPVLSVSALLASGAGPASLGGANRLLSARPLVWLGNSSYALYLWHWPILVAYLSLSFESQPSFVAGTVVLAVSVLLAVLTTRFIEAPVRALTVTMGTAETLKSVAVAIGVLVLGVMAWEGSRRMLIKAELARLSTAVPGTPPYLGALARRMPPEESTEATVLPGPFTVRWQRGTVYSDGCVQTMAKSAIVTCRYGGGSHKTLAVVGGSHSAQWMPALIKAFEAFPDWQIATYLKAACPFSTEPVSPEPTYRDSCSLWNEQVKDTLIANPPDAVFLPGTRTSRQETGMPEMVPQGYRDQWLPLVEAGIQIIVIRDTPRFGFDVPRCVFQRGQASRRCTVERHQVLATQNPMYTLPERDLLYVVDLSDELCNDSLCEPVIGNLLVYRDAGHVSPAYMTTLSETLRRALAPILQK